MTSVIDEIYRSESRRILATLIRLLGDFDLAEEAMQDAFAAALEQWPKMGVPSNPRAWLVSTGRFKGIDAIRKRQRFDVSLALLAERIDTDSFEGVEDLELRDDDLRLIFTCCHPALQKEAQIALTLREVCGLTTEETARAFLISASTAAQRIVRAKAKIRDARIPYQVPSSEDLPERLDSVLHVVYLVFNEGYSASFGPTLTRADLSGEAIRLGRLLYSLLPEPEVAGLLALMLLQESRREARSTEEGDLILLEDQDRSKWNREQIEEGLAYLRQALDTRGFGCYVLQASIAAVHAEAGSPQETNWSEIVALYDVLARVEPSPVIDLNRAVAIAMRDGPEAGLALISQLMDMGDLDDYYLAHSAIGELRRRAGDYEGARIALKRALELTEQEPEKRLLRKKLESLT